MDENAVGGLALARIASDGITVVEMWMTLRVETHFASIIWLDPCPEKKISGGRILVTRADETEAGLPSHSVCQRDRYSNPESTPATSLGCFGL
jgi:hypothetical protein